MLFLGDFYQQVILPHTSHFNHLPLIKLMVKSLDKTILYFIIYLVLRGLYLLMKKRPVKWGHESLVGLFVFYLLLLISLTVLRDIYYPWQMVFHWQRSLSQINLTPLVETFKLKQGVSQLDYWYNFYGNILWFIPFGLLRPLLVQHRFKGVSVILQGAALSFCIETSQFILGTGVADIDDLIFNTVGAIIGVFVYYLAYLLMKFVKMKRFKK